MGMSNKAPSEYLKEPYGRVIVPDTNGGYYGEILEFPGCLASGETPAETLKNLEEVAAVWIASEQERGHNIPPPATVEEYSGKFALRLPRSLHQQAARMAEREGTSLNQYFVAVIAAKVGAEDLCDRAANRLADIARPYAYQAPIIVNVYPGWTEAAFVPLRTEKMTETPQTFRRFETQEVPNG